MVGDSAWFSADTNTTGDPSVYREVIFNSEYGNDHCVWGAKSKLVMYLDGHAEIWTTHVDDGAGFGGVKADFWIELYFSDAKQTVRYNRDQFCFFVWAAMDLRGSKDNIWRIFPVDYGIAAYQYPGSILICWRHAHSQDGNSEYPPPGAHIIQPIR